VPEGAPAAKPSEAKPAEAKPAAAAPAAEKPKAAPAAAQAVAVAPEEVKASPRARRLADTEKVPLAIIHGSGPEGRVIEEDVEKYLEETRDLKVSPAAREIAFQRNIDLRRVQGSGPNGRINKEDVEAIEVAAPAAAPTPSAAPAAGGRVELTAMRKIVAQRMTESKTTIPHFYLTVEMDMSNVIALRKKINEENNAKVSYNDILRKACADAYAKVPRMNSTWNTDHVVVYDTVDISLAVSIDEGLMVPVVRNVQSKDYQQISQDTQNLIQRARSKKLTPDEYEGGSLTISNLGMFGMDSFIPILNPGQAAILGIGRIQEKVVVRDGGIHIRPMMLVTLSGDHRIVNGAEAAEWLGEVKNILETLTV